MILMLLGALDAHACSGGCTSDVDCVGNACVYCDTDFGVCADCCEFTEQVICPDACTWSSNECRNDVSVSCGIVIPETPQKSRYLFFTLILLGALGISAYVGRRRLRALGARKE